MKIYHATLVKGDLNSVIKKFDQILFEKLSPPLMDLNVKRFDGCKKDDEIHLEMSLLGKKSNWISLITTSSTLEDEFYFIDEGKLLPFPLTYWKHTHSVKKISNHECMVIDEIDYSASNSLLTNLVYPIFYTMFYLRKPIYVRELKNE